MNRALTHSKLLIVLCVVLFTATGCAKKQVKLTQTGFLTNYADLEEDKEIKGLRIYKNPNVKISEKYSKIMIEPVKFRLSESVAEDLKLSEEDREKLTDYYYEKLVEGLVENYRITYEPGPDVLRLRTAVTDILPNKIYLNLHWTTTLYGAGIGGASLEAELVDSLTGERMLAFIDARKGRKLNYTKGLTKWGHTKEVLGIWANLIVDNLDQMRTKYSAIDEEMRRIESGN